MEESEISLEQLRYWKARGLDVMVWTVNDPERKDYLKFLGVPYITDDASR